VAFAQYRLPSFEPSHLNAEIAPPIEGLTAAATGKLARKKAHSMKVSFRNYSQPVNFAGDKPPICVARRIAQNVCNAPGAGEGHE
jgi:hypothetical protein